MASRVRVRLSRGGARRQRPRVKPEAKEQRVDRDAAGAYDPRPGGAAGARPE